MKLKFKNSKEEMILFTNISKKYKKYYNLLRYKYSYLFNDNFIFSDNYSKEYSKYIFLYEYKSIFISYSNKIKKIIRKNKIKNIIENNINILLNKKLDLHNLIEIEIIKKYNLLKNNLSILEITNFPIFIDSIDLLKKKYINMKYNINYFTKYKYYGNGNYKKNILKEINFKIYNNYINLNYIINKNNKKQDIIYSNLSVHSDIMPEFFEFGNSQIFFYIFLYSLYNLKKNGHFIYFIRNINNKFTADILLLSKKYFKKVHIYKPKIIPEIKMSGIYVIFYKFIGINKNKLKEFNKIFEQLYEKDNTGYNFNVYNKKQRKIYRIVQKINKDSIFTYPSQLLDLPDTSRKYDFIRNLNDEFYMKKIIFLNRMIENYKLYYKKKKIPKQIREKQLINSYLYAKEFDLDTIPFDKGTFTSDFGKLIIQDMYSYHVPICFNFSKLTEDIETVSEKIDLFNELEKIKNNLLYIQDAIESRNIKDWESEKLKVRYYKSSPKYQMQQLKDLISKKFLNGKVISQAWIKMYEILSKFKLINGNLKTLKSFHMCELPGNFISATDYYIKSNTKIKNFNWKGQSLNPNNTPEKYKKKAFGDSGYGILKSYPDRWDFGKDNTGDITNIENIKYYKEVCKKIKLLTSDCGLGFPTFDEKSMLMNKKVHFAEMVFMFNNLPKNGNYICKFYIPIYYRLDVNLIYLLIKYFKEVYFYKPLQNMTSSEFYIVCKKYKTVPKKILEKLFSMLENFSNKTFDEEIVKSKIFMGKNIYSNSFIHQLINATTKLTNNVIFYIERQFYYVDNKDYIPKEHYDVIKKYSDKKNKEWIKKFKLKKIKESNLGTEFFDKGTFTSDLGKMILNDMYSLHQPLIFEFVKRNTKLYKEKHENVLNNDNTNILSIYDELDNISRLFHSIMSAIDLRNIKNWNSEKKKSRYYDKGIYELDKLKKLVSKKYTNDFEISQAWLKMYEMCNLFNLISKKRKTFKSMHICELPGNFIAAINHYIKTKTKIEKFEWKGQSLNPNHKDNIKKYGKSIINEKPYNFYTKYRDQWDFGKDNTGDITNIENIKYYKEICKDINLLTSDCGLGWSGTNDISLKKAYFASILFIFNNLPKNGNFVAKFVLPIDNVLEIEMIYLIYKQFKKVYIYKPLQNMYSGEFYIIGIKYTPISNLYLDKMFEILKTFDKKSFNKKIQKSKYPKSFIYQLSKSINDITNNWIFYIKRQFYYVDNAKYIPKEHYETVKKYVYKKNIDWIKKFKIKKINKYDML